VRLEPKRKTADETLDYDINFERWLSEPDAVVDAAVTAGPGITIERVQIFSSIVKVWVSGGETYRNYDIKTLATTAEGRVVEVCFNLRITDC
jgi:hypothetical protein